MPKVTGKRKVANEVEWERKDVRIQVRNGAEAWRTVSALVYGSVAVYPCPFEDGVWSVACLPLGVRLVYVTDMDDALRAAEHLQDTCGDALASKTESVAHSRLPAWVGPWCRRVNKERRWVNPVEFRDKGKYDE